MQYDIQLSIEEAIAYLCRPDVGNFYAYAVNTLERVYTKAIPTFCVGPMGSRYVMMINPDFAEKQPFDRLTMIIEHELLHILLRHPTRGYDLWHLCETDEDRRYFFLAKPIAVDAAVNELVRQKHSDDVMVPKNVPKELEEYLFPAVLAERYELPRDQSFDVYLGLLMQKFRALVPDPEKIIDEVVKRIKKEIEAGGGVKVGSILDGVLQGMKDQQGDSNDDEQAEGESKAENKDANGEAASAQGAGDANDGDTEGDASDGGAEGPGDAGSSSTRSGNRDGSSDSPSQSSDGDPSSGRGDGCGDGDGDGDALPAPGSRGPKLSKFETMLVNDLVHSILEHLSEYLEDVSDPAQARHLDEHGKSVIRSAMNTVKKTRGNVPGHIAELIEAFLRKPTVSWTELLHALVVNAQKSKPKRGMKRISKTRAALSKWFEKTRGVKNRSPLFPGTERDKKFTLYYVVDTSGSMSTADMAAGLSELKHVQKASSDMEIYVLYVDCSVSKVYRIGPNDELDTEMTGRGGTEFEVAFSYIHNNARQCDLVIYVTDGYAPQPSTKLACSTVWLITAGGKPIMPNMPGHITLQMRDYGVGETL